MHDGQTLHDGKDRAVQIESGAGKNGMSVCTRRVVIGGVSLRLHCGTAARCWCENRALRDEACLMLAYARRPSLF